MVRECQVRLGTTCSLPIDRSAMATPNPLDGAQEIQELVVGYARQETVEPLKRLGTYLGWGLAGSLAIFMGALFVGLGTLRLTQGLDVFIGTSWASLAPYSIALLVLILMIALMYRSLSKARKKVL